MNSAAFDSSHGLAFTVKDDEHVLIDAHEPSHGHGTEVDFVQWIRQLLSGTGISLATISRWTVGTGPGSFTGIRLGVGFVKGVCLQTCAGYRGVPSSAALAAQAGEGLSAGETLAVLNDARRSQVIISPYQKKNDGALQPLSEPVIVDADDLEKACRPHAALVTAQAKQIEPYITTHLQARLQLAGHVPASRFLELAGWQWPQTLSEQERSCEPIYVRPAVFVKPHTATPSIPE